VTMTPVEIEAYKFSKSLRGYSVDEVDNFLEKVSKDYETLYRQYQEQKEKINQLEKDLKSYRELEKTLNDTLVLAQKAAEETKKNAEKEAELMIKEAEAKAEKLIEQAREAVKKQEERLEELKKRQRVFAAEFKSLLMTQLELLERENIEEEASNEDLSKTG